MPAPKIINTVNVKDANDVNMDHSNLNEFKGFLSTGSVSSISKLDFKKEILILHGSACAQSMLVKDVLPFEPLPGNRSVLIEGI